MTFNVTLEGNFVLELDINAASENEAMEKGKELLNKKIGLLPEDYVVDMITVKETE